MSLCPRCNRVLIRKLKDVMDNRSMNMCLRDCGDLTDAVLVGCEMARVKWLEELLAEAAVIAARHEAAHSTHQTSATGHLESRINRALGKV